MGAPWISQFLFSLAIRLSRSALICPFFSAEDIEALHEVITQLADERINPVTIVKMRMT